MVKLWQYQILREKFWLLVNSRKDNKVCEKRNEHIEVFFRNFVAEILVSSTINHWNVSKFCSPLKAVNSVLNLTFNYVYNFVMWPWFGSDEDCKQSTKYCNECSSSFFLILNSVVPSQKTSVFVKMLCSGFERCISQRFLWSHVLNIFCH